MYTYLKTNELLEKCYSSLSIMSSTHVFHVMQIFTVFSSLIFSFVLINSELPSAMSSQTGRGGGPRARGASTKSQEDRGCKFLLYSIQKPCTTPSNFAKLTQVSPGQNIQVFARARPMNDQEKYVHLVSHNVLKISLYFRSGKTYSVVETGMKDLTVKGINNQHNKTYQFDRCFSIIIWFQSYNKSSCIARVFGPKSEQIHVYRSVVEPLLEEVITHKQGEGGGVKLFLPNLVHL